MERRVFLAPVMPKPNACCNPLQKKCHNNIYKNIQKVTNRWDESFTYLIDKYVCGSCRLQFRKAQDSLELQKVSYCATTNCAANNTDLDSDYWDSDYSGSSDYENDPLYEGTA